jgi:hypothetical protein
MFANKVLRRIFGPKRVEVTGEWRRLHNEELNDLYSSNIIRVIKSRRKMWEGHVARMGRGDVHTGFWWGDLSEGRPRRRWEDNIKMDLQEVGWEGMDWIDMTQVRDRWRAVVSAVMNLWVPYNAGNFLIDDRLASQKGLCSLELVRIHSAH